MNLTLYGIRQCDTVKKARKWLDAHHVEYGFHDLRVDGLSRDQVRRWISHLENYEILLNRRGTTWRRPDDADKHELDEQRAIQLMLENPTVIKRPVLEWAESVHVGFDESVYADLLGSRAKK